MARARDGGKKRYFLEFLPNVIPRPSATIAAVIFSNGHLVRQKKNGGREWAYLSLAMKLNFYANLHFQLAAAVGPVINPRLSIGKKQNNIIFALTHWGTHSAHHHAGF